MTHEGPLQMILLSQGNLPSLFILLENSGSLGPFHASANIFMCISTNADIDSPRDNCKTAGRVPYIITWKREGPNDHQWSIWWLMWTLLWTLLRTRAKDKPRAIRWVELAKVTVNGAWIRCRRRPALSFHSRKALKQANSSVLSGLDNHCPQGRQWPEGGPEELLRCCGIQFSIYGMIAWECPLCDSY